MNIALVIHGGIGVGYKQQGIPVIVNFAERIGEIHHLTVYTFTRPHPDFRAKNYKLVHCTKITFIPLICLHHFRSRFAWVHGIWAYPGGFWAVLAARVLKVRAMVSFFGGECVYLPKIKFGLAQSHKKRISWVCRKAEKITVLSEYQRRIVQKNFPEVKAEVISLGADTKLFFPQKQEKDEILQLLNVAHMNKVKNHALLLNAFQQVLNTVDARLTILGVDTLKGEIQKLARDLGIEDKIRFKGDVLHQEVKDFLGASHILVHTSSYEAQAVVVNEAMACGVPVCGTSAGIIADLKNEYVIGIEEENAELLSKEIIDLWKNEAKYNYYAEAGLAYTKGNNFDHTIEQYEKLYDEINNKDHSLPI
ncbi:MAG: glycosyltransferase family 4 protein [Bacteroidia bacterium]